MAADGLHTTVQMHASVRKRVRLNVKRVSLTLKRMAQICSEQNAPAAEDADRNAESTNKDGTILFGHRPSLPCVVDSCCNRPSEDINETN